MRAVALAALALMVGLVGCLQGGEPAPDEQAVEPTAADTNETVTDGNETTDRSTSNGTQAPTNDTTSQPNATGEPPTNETDDPEADEQPPPLPGNLSMAGAEVVERSDEQVRFRWTASIGPDGTDTAFDAGTTFDVPAGIPLRINATLTWSDESDLALTVDGEHIDAYCSSDTPTDAGLEGGRETCQVRTFARSSWDEWRVRVDGQALGNDAPARPANVTVELSIERAEPWTGPPVEAPEPAAGAVTDPGWPAIEDAEIRPGVKVGPLGSSRTGTGSYLFSSPDNRTLYLGWVAHGVVGLEPGDTVRLPTAGVEATLVYCSWGVIEGTATCPSLDIASHPRAANDLAMLRLPADARGLVHPATPVWGGPTGSASSPAQGDRLLAFGNTPFRDGGQTGINALDPMRGAAWSSTEKGTQAYLSPQPVPGDSGSPVLTGAGRAVGPISAIGPPAIGGSPSSPSPDPSEGPTLVSNLAHALDVMENETALDVELKTWPLFETPRLQDLAEPPASP